MLAKNIAQLDQLKINVDY